MENVRWEKNMFMCLISTDIVDCDASFPSNYQSLIQYAIVTMLVYYYKRREYKRLTALKP